MNRRDIFKLFLSSGFFRREFLQKIAAIALFVSNNNESSSVEIDYKKYITPEDCGDDINMAVKAAFVLKRTLILKKIYTLDNINSDGYLITLIGGISIRAAGENCGFRVADGLAPYVSIIGAHKNADVSKLDIRGIVFDHNEKGNVNIKNNNNGNYRHTIKMFRCRDFIIRKNTIIGSTGRQSFFINEGSQNNAVCRGDIRDNSWQDFGYDPNKVISDSSVIYINGADINVIGNSFHAASYGANGARCAIEIHSTRTNISNNKIWGFFVAINLCGIRQSGVVQDIVCENNIIDVVLNGIRLFSTKSGEHRSGDGLSDVLVKRNKIRIRQLTADPSMLDTARLFGIGIYQSTDLAIRRVQVIENSIEYDYEEKISYYSNPAPAIGVVTTRKQNKIIFEEIHFDNNKIINSPGMAVALGTGGGVLINCSALNNLAINPCQSKSINLRPSSKIPLFSYSYSIQGELNASIEIRDLREVPDINYWAQISTEKKCSEVPINISISANVVGDLRELRAAIKTPDNNNVIPYVLIKCNKNLLSMKKTWRGIYKKGSKFVLIGK